MSNTFEKRIGNTIYVVSVQPSATAKKTLDEKIRELCRKEVESPDFGRVLSSDQIGHLIQDAVGA
ncbi:MAG: hypothetical protein ENTB_00012 [Enterocloster aldenensis]